MSSSWNVCPLVEEGWARAEHGLSVGVCLQTMVTGRSESGSVFMRESPRSLLAAWQLRRRPLKRQDSSSSHPHFLSAIYRAVE